MAQIKNPQASLTWGNLFETTTSRYFLGGALGFSFFFFFFSLFLPFFCSLFAMVNSFHKNGTVDLPSRRFPSSEFGACRQPSGRLLYISGGGVVTPRRPWHALARR